MSNNAQAPTAEQIRAARHAGFDDSVRHMPEARRNKLTSAHRAQDGRRENNIRKFYQTVVGQG